MPDPWLSARMTEYAYVRRAEAQLHPAIRDAVAAYLEEARAGLLGALTAAAGDTPDDPPGLPPESRWRAILERFVLGPSRALWRGSYGRVTGRPDDTPDDDQGHGETLGERLAGFRRAVADRVRRALTIGRDRAETPEQLRDRVAALMTLEEWDGQVMTMTRTETMTALNSGAMHGALAEQERTGQPWEKRWQATHDQRVRHTHRTADGQIRPLTEPFEVGDTRLQFPGDPRGSAGEVINCRCAARYGPAGDPALTAAAVRFHGTPGRPSYRKYHPSGRNKKPQGLTRHKNGGWLGSARFTEDEHFTAVKRYSRSGYRRMNQLLRSGPEGMTDADLEIIRPRVAALTDLIAVQEPTTTQTTLYRGVEDALAMGVGDEFHDRGFVSTSTRESVSQGFTGDGGAMFRIVVPPGSQILPIESVGEDDDEGEVILPPGTKFRVTRVIREGTDTTAPYYEVEVTNG